MGGYTGKCERCGRSQHWDSSDFEIICLKQMWILSKFGVICHFCEHQQIIHDDFHEGPRPDDKWYDDNPPYQMEGETDGQYADRMYFDEDGNPR